MEVPGLPDKSRAQTVGRTGVAPDLGPQRARETPQARGGRREVRHGHSGHTADVDNCERRNVPARDLGPHRRETGAVQAVCLHATIFHQHVRRAAHHGHLAGVAGARHRGNGGPRAGAGLAVQRETVGRAIGHGEHVAPRARGGNGLEVLAGGHCGKRAPRGPVKNRSRHLGTAANARLHRLEHRGAAGRDIAGHNVGRGQRASAGAVGGPGPEPGVGRGGFRHGKGHRIVGLTGHPHHKARVLAIGQGDGAVLKTQREILRPQALAAAQAQLAMTYVAGTVAAGTACLAGAEQVHVILVTLVSLGLGDWVHAIHEQAGTADGHERALLGGIEGREIGDVGICATVLQDKVLAVGEGRAHGHGLAARTRGRQSVGAGVHGVEREPAAVGPGDRQRPHELGAAMLSHDVPHAHGHVAALADLGRAAAIEVAGAKDMERLVGNGAHARKMRGVHQRVVERPHARRAQ